MNIAICDDEENIRIYIRKLIQKQETFCKITEFSSGKELLEFQDETNAEEIDILFLDISMGDEDGMTVAKQLRSQMESKKEAVWGSLPLLIFVTGYPEYMQEAFSVNAFQYIVKPIQESNFEQVFAQTIREYQYLMAKKKEKPKEVLVRNGNRTRSVSADDIYYIESQGHTLILHTILGDYETTGKMKEMDEKLSGMNFCRGNKGYLINLQHVDRIQDNCAVVKGEELVLSRARKKEFMEALTRYWGEVIK